MPFQAFMEKTAGRLCDCICCTRARGSTCAERMSEATELHREQNTTTSQGDHT